MALDRLQRAEHLRASGGLRCRATGPRQRRGRLPRPLNATIGVFAMCRSIKTLHNFEPPATDDEVRASSLQFVRKLSGFTRPSQANDVAFNRVVEQVAQAARALGLESRGHRLVTSVLRERLF